MRSKRFVYLDNVVAVVPHECCHELCFRAIKVPPKENAASPRFGNAGMFDNTHCLLGDRSRPAVVDCPGAVG